MDSNNLQVRHTHDVLQGVNVLGRLGVDELGEQQAGVAGDEDEAGDLVDGDHELGLLGDEQILGAAVVEGGTQAEEGSVHQ